MRWATPRSPPTSRLFWALRAWISLATFLNTIQQTTCSQEELDVVLFFWSTLSIHCIITSKWPCRENLSQSWEESYPEDSSIRWMWGVPCRLRAIGTMRHTNAQTLVPWWMTPSSHAPRKKCRMYVTLTQRLSLLNFWFSLNNSWLIFFAESVHLKFNVAIITPQKECSTKPGVRNIRSYTKVSWSFSFWITVLGKLSDTELLNYFSWALLCLLVKVSNT